jgi:hypothetical protein
VWAFGFGFAFVWGLGRGCHVVVLNGFGEVRCLVLGCGFFFGWDVGWDVGVVFSGHDFEDLLRVYGSMGILDAKK